MMPVLELLTLSEAARTLGVTKRTLMDARDRGEFPVIRLGDRWQRVDVEDLRAWLASKKETPCRAQ